MTTPGAADLVPGAALAAVGRAARFAAGAAEIWRLPRDADRIAARLLELGRAGVGGFVASGEDDDGPWIARAAGTPELAAWLEENSGPVAWPRAAAIARAIADAAAACERAHLCPGAIEPASVVVRDGAVELRAERLVRALVGAADVAATAVPGTRWLPPEASTASNATNRYAIGLVLYRLLAGEHPFGGRGLRHGLADQASRGAPPFAETVAAHLPPGLQALCLRMLDPDPAKRPATAAVIASELKAFETPPIPGHAERGARSAPSRSAPPSTRPALRTELAQDARKSSRRSAHRLLALAPLALGVALAWWLIDRVTPSRSRVAVAAAAPLASAKQLADCATCHPRHAAEWSRSVMAHAMESPLFQSLEILIQEQVGRDRDCPNGAGILRTAGAAPCTNRRTGVAITGSGGALWCVNCHAPGENLPAGAAMPAWDARAVDAGSRRPLRDLLPASTMEGISCAGCHSMTGPVHAGDAATGRYEGNPTWTSPDTGITFVQRPEDARGVFGIANSGYAIDPGALVGGGELVAGGAHRATSPAARAYRASSEFCGACHDVRLFGTDTLGIERGEHFKRLRNAYSEWASWADGERRAGRAAATCQDCHMSLYPGVCETSPGTTAASGCPDGTAFAPRPPGSYATGRAATGAAPGSIHTHYFTGVDVPLSGAFDPRAAGDPTVDVAGLPVGARQRRDLLLASAFRFAIDAPSRAGDRLSIPIVVENIGAGHRVPAGFSQEREIWVHLRVTDATGAVVYEVGRVERGDQDLADKVFLRVTTSDELVDGRGRPLGMFGADVADGPDVPRWTPASRGSTTAFRGDGLINFQNGFLRCVRCIGEIDARGQCQPGPGQAARRADRYDDGDYDPDTGACRSNLDGEAALFETYFPVGALDATRGILKAPDAIIDTRSLSPGEPVRYVYDLPATARGPFTVEATLEFRAFPPYLIRAFAAYEASQARRGLRPSGALVDGRALERLEVVHVATARAVIE